MIYLVIIMKYILEDLVNYKNWNRELYVIIVYF